MSRTDEPEGPVGKGEYKDEEVVYETRIVA